LHLKRNKNVRVLENIYSGVREREKEKIKILNAESARNANRPNIMTMEILNVHEYFIVLNKKKVEKQFANIAH